MRLSDKNKQGTHSRREALAGAAMAGMGSLLGTASRVQAQSPMGADEVFVASIGQYDTVLLRQRAIKVSAIQSRARAVDLKNLKKTMQVNLDHLTQLIDYAQGSAEACGGERFWAPSRI